MKKKPPKKVAAPPHVWHVGDRCKKPPLQGIYEITHISHDGREVNLCLNRTNFELFRVPIELIVPEE